MAGYHLVVPVEVSTSRWRGRKGEQGLQTRMKKGKSPATKSNREVVPTARPTEIQTSHTEEPPTTTASLREEARTMKPYKEEERPGGDGGVLHFRKVMVG